MFWKLLSCHIGVRYFIYGTDVSDKALFHLNFMLYIFRAYYMLARGYSAVTLTSLIPLNAGHRPNAAIELTHHLQRRSSTRLALGRCLVFAGM